MTSSVNKRVLRDITVGRENLKNDFGILISPEDNNYYNVHFILPGPGDTPYEGGLYHGMIRLNERHPFAPPNLHIFTPNGRFEEESCPVPKGSRGICTTDTAFHPDEWNAAKDIEKILKGFLSLMCEEHDPKHVSIRGIKTPISHRKKLAEQSRQHLIASNYAKMLFPDLHESLVNGTYKPVNLTELGTNSKVIKNEPNKLSKTKSKTNISVSVSGSESSELSESADFNPKKCSKKISNRTSKKTKSNSESESSELLESQDNLKKHTKKMPTKSKSKKTKLYSESDESQDNLKKHTKKMPTKSKSKKSKLDSESLESLESLDNSKKRPKKLPTKSKSKKSMLDSESDESLDNSKKRSKKLPTKSKSKSKSKKLISISDSDSDSSESPDNSKKSSKKYHK